MDTRNSYTIVEVLNRSSYACVVCLQKLETPPITLGCGCSIMAHAACLSSSCPNCKKKSSSFCLSRSQKYDKVLACAIVTVLGLVCIAILLLVLKFKYNML